MEKMASLGKLSSMIAHELNNPLSGILTYAKLIKKRLLSNNLDPDKLETITKDLTLISDEAKRCGEIVKNLLFFARSEEGTHIQCDICDVKKRLKFVTDKLTDFFCYWLRPMN